MSIIRELQEQLQGTQTAAFVTTMIRDISATKLQSVREEFDANKAYFKELHELTAMVTQYAYANDITLPSTAKRQRVYIALTANKRFYGNLNANIMRRFYEELRAVPEAAGIVVGQTGEMYAREHYIDREFRYITFNADTPSAGEIKSLIALTETYAEVHVVHPTFINSFTQEAVVTDITHQPAEFTDKVPTVDYIAEPDIQAMLQFFMTQTRMVLCNRAIMETSVALLGARLMKMQRARERATAQVKEERRTIHRHISTMKNLRLLEAFAGFTSDRSL